MQTQFIVTFDISEEFIQEAFNKVKRELNNDDIIVAEVEEEICEVLSTKIHTLLKDKFVDDGSPQLVSVELGDSNGQN